MDSEQPSLRYDSLASYVARKLLLHQLHQRGTPDGFGSAASALTYRLRLRLPGSPYGAGMDRAAYEEGLLLAWTDRIRTVLLEEPVNAALLVRIAEGVESPFVPGPYGPDDRSQGPVNPAVPLALPPRDAQLLAAAIARRLFEQDDHRRLSRDRFVAVVHADPSQFDSMLPRQGRPWWERAGAEQSFLEGWAHRIHNNLAAGRISPRDLLEVFQPDASSDPGARVPAGKRLLAFFRGGRG